MRKFAPAVLVLLAAHVGCRDHKYDPDDYVIGPSSLDQVLTISSERQSLPADGFTRTLIRAQITPHADAAHRTVKFTTTAGTLIAHESAKDVDVVADSAGVAVIHLESEKAIRTALIRASVGEVVRETSVDFVAVIPSDVVTLAASDVTIPADGRSVTRIVASVAPGLPTDRKKVQFVTTLGTFAESEQKTYNPASTINDQAGAHLRSTERGGARVVAQVDGVAAEMQVQFVTALPEEVTITTERFFIPASDVQVVVTARLWRSIGVPTEGQQVQFTASIPGGLTVGQFSAIERSKADGSATAAFSARGVLHRGRVRITATVAGLSGAADVEVVDP